MLLHTKKFQFISFALLLSLGGFTGGSAASSLNATPVQSLSAPLFNNLGHYHHAIITQSPLAARYFDQGLILFYGFDYAESIRSFREAIRQDPSCAMCYWGLALSLGSKNNTPLNGHEVADAIRAIEKAQQLAALNHSAQEKAYIDALALRYKKTAATTLKVQHIGCHTTNSIMPTQASAYAEAMRKVVMLFPNDIDAKNLYAASLFDAMDWTFYTKNGTPLPQTKTLLQILTAAMQQDKLNPASHHYYIHVIEQSKNPRQATESADLLGHLVPGAHHLVHMPAHIDFLTGRYHAASQANQNAITAFENYQASCRQQGFAPEINYLYQHNFRFLIASALMEGRSQLALNTAQALVAQIPLAAQEELQTSLIIPYVVKARFGLWQAILSEPKPPAKLHYVTGIWHYARAMAFIELDNATQAEQELKQLIALIHQTTADKTVDKNTQKLLFIAVEVIQATLSAQEGRTQQQLLHWRNAVQLQEELPYEEPPAWYFPTRQGYGYALLQAKQPQLAQQIFQQDLAQYPNNGWSLFGLVQALQAQGKDRQAATVLTQFKTSWQYADVQPTVGSS